VCSRSREAFGFAWCRVDGLPDCFFWFRWASAQTGDPASHPNDVNRVAPAALLPRLPEHAARRLRDAACCGLARPIRKAGRRASEQQIIDYFVRSTASVCGPTAGQGFKLNSCGSPCCLVAGAAALVVILRVWSGRIAPPAGVSAPGIQPEGGGGS